MKRRTDYPVALLVTAGVLAFLSLVVLLCSGWLFWLMLGRPNGFDPSVWFE
jgi:hypothetical protein